MEENEIITAVLGGNVDAFAPLVDRYHIGIIIYCQQFGLDRTSAEDLAQDIFLAAYQRLKKYQPNRASFSTWLYQLAQSRCLDELRRKRIHIDLADLPEIVALTEPLSEAEKSEIRSAVQKLKPPVYRQVIEAYYWHGKSYDDIAREFELPLNTVRTNLRRAKLQLKGVLA